MPTDQPIPASPDAARHGREQAAAYHSPFAPHDMTLHYPDGTQEVIEIPPHPNLGLLDDENQEAYEELLFTAEETYEREPDVVLPEQRLDNGIVIPSETRRGALKSPYRIKGEDGKSHLVKPPWRVQVCQAALGKEKFDKLKAAGLGAADVWRLWNEQAQEVADRNTVDPKSVRGRGAVAAVSRGDS